jgi:hypothetical protein
VISPQAAYELNWFWISVMLVAPLPVALLVAWPIWRFEQPLLGNLAASAVIYGFAIALILRESIELRRIAEACLAVQTTCWPSPSEFTRDVIYASIALAHVIVVFLISLRFEERLRRRNYAPEWR